VIANSGPEGMSKINLGSFDVIIVQIDMEVINGRDIAQHVRSSEQRYGNRALIIGSADDPTGDMLRDSMKSGIDQVTERPVKKKFLKALLSSYR